MPVHKEGSTLACAPAERVVASFLPFDKNTFSEYGFILLFFPTLSEAPGGMKTPRSKIQVSTHLRSRQFLIDLDYPCKKRLIPWNTKMKESDRMC
jgi:hypothetical protein